MTDTTDNFAAFTEQVVEYIHDLLDSPADDLVFTTAMLGDLEVVVVTLTVDDDGTVKPLAVMINEDLFDRLVPTTGQIVPS